MLAHLTTFAGGSAELLAIDQSLAVIVFGVDGTVLRANANFLRLYGYKARELIGRARAIFVPSHATDAEADAKRWAALLRGEPQMAECRRVRKDGSLLWVHAQYTPVADADGKLVEVVMFVTDITEHKRRHASDQWQIEAIGRSHAVAHYALDGSLIDANDLFLRTMGYRADEIAGCHHRLFVDPARASHDDERDLWSALAQGQHRSGLFRRVSKGGSEVWLRATYSPVLDMHGAVSRIVEHAVDVTEETLRRVDHEGQIQAINKSRGVITFDLHGTVLDANENFLQAMGYRLEEIQGRHHRMFVEPSFAHGAAYANFWNQLVEGRQQSGEYRRVGKNGRELWLRASYNPIHDLDGKPVKVVTYATVITREKLWHADHQGQIASIHKAQCVVAFDLDGIILDANDNFLDATGYSLADVRGQHHSMFVDPVAAASADYRTFWTDLARGQHKTAEFKRRCKDGREIWLQASYNPIFDMNGRPFKVVKYAIDVTRERLRQLEHEGQLAAIDKSQCVASFAMDGTILSVNANFLAAMGYERHELEGRHHRFLVNRQFGESEEYRVFWETLRSGRFLSARYKRVGKGGREVWIQASYNPILDLDGRPIKVIKIATDVSADVELAADFVAAREQALHDAATGLANRVGLTRFMTAALGRPDSRIALLYLDLDHFKPINDTFGHDVGDHVLRETARRLLESVRPDDIVARVGGDEFVVAAVDLSDEQIDLLCQRLIGVVQAPIRHAQGTLAVGLSIGVAVSPHDALTADDLLRCADVALYRTKGNGRGSYSFFAVEMGQRLSARRHLAEEMRHGIKAGQFFLEYQPRFDARTRRLHSASAVVRWAHPVNGVLEPADFLPLAERSGLIVPLGEWSLRTACHGAAAWPTIGVTVTVSPIHFAGIDFARVVEAALVESGLEPHRLELDMGERALIDDAPRAHAALTALKALGVRLVLNDYGTHQTSLDSVRAFPFDAVKIDRRFIADVEGEADGPRIVRDVRRMTQDLSVPVATHGVETNGHLLVLDLAPDAQVQALLLADAMPAQALQYLFVDDESSSLQREDSDGEAQPAQRPTASVD